MKALPIVLLVLLASVATAQPGGPGGPGGPPLQPLGAVPAPVANPVTPAKASLGKVLFWDEQLSSTRTTACGTCHIPAAGGDDPRSIEGDPSSTHPGPDGIFGNADDVTGSPGLPLSNAIGDYLFEDSFGIDVQVTPRRARSAINAGFADSLFWDGRAGGTFVDPTSGATLIPGGAALESQVLGPPLGTGEMSHVGRDWLDVAARVEASAPLALAPEIPASLATWIDGRTYHDLFLEAFGTADVTPARIAMAIATYERTLVSDQTPLDDQLTGANALTPLEQQGMGVFMQANCSSCHRGPRLTDDRFHYIGVRPVNEDLGRFEVTGNPQDRGRMRTPELRNIELRPPYMRNGRFSTLREVVDFYDRGGDFDAPNRANQIRPLNLSNGQKNALVAFLERPLTDPRVLAEQAPFDRPLLYSESSRVPQVVGNGVPGTGGIAPDVIAIEPPLLGNPSFTVGVMRALGGAQAVLVVDTATPPANGPVPDAADVFSSSTITLAGQGAGAGHGSVSLALPSSSLMRGVSLAGRWYVADPAAPEGVASSPAFQFRLFGEGTTPDPNDPAPEPNDPTPDPNDPTPDPNDPTPDPNDPVPPAAGATAAFVGYAAKAPRLDAAGEKLENGNQLPGPWIISVNDAAIADDAPDDPENFEVRRAKAILRAVDSEDASYLRYQMKRAGESIAPAVDGNLERPAKHAPRMWSLRNDLGTINVTTRRVRSLLLPTAAAEDGPPAAPDDAVHYVCYNARATTDATEQTPAGARGRGSFRRDLQVFMDDTGESCGGSFAGTDADGACLVDLRKVVELCNPMTKTAVEPPRETVATGITESIAPAGSSSLLCYQSRLSTRFRSEAAANRVGRRPGDRIAPPQDRSSARRVRTGNALFVAPGNGFPAPTILETKSRQLTCLPTEILSVSLR